MKIENTSNGKIIGIGNVTILPGETKEIPEAYETSPILEVYKQKGFAMVTGRPKTLPESEANTETKKMAAEQKAAEDAETLRQARMASLNGISEEDLGKLANDLGINPAECKDKSDVLKKVKTALKK